MNARVSVAAVLLTAASCSLITGCSQMSSFPTVETSSATSPASAKAETSSLSGRIHGGQQPITNAKIYLLAAGNSGYGSASQSLLTSASYPGYASQTDANGNYYVTTDSNGFFQIADSCTPGQQVYVASVGGNPGFGSNSAANEIALLGTCPQAGNFDSALTGVFLSEISTVAAAYTASAYAVDTFHIGAPNTTLAQTGINNAFANAANLFDVQNLNDTARTTTAVGNGTVPQAKLHTIANILASCINSIGPSSPACSTLFSYAKTGGTTGTAPLDVTAAAINIAHNPNSSAVSTLYALQGANYPFGPNLTSAPADFSVAVTYPNAAQGNNPSLAVDGSGNLWTLTPGNSAVTKISPTGAIPVPQYSIGNGFAGSRGLAIDASNNVWVLGQGTAGELVLGSLVNFPVSTFAELSPVGVYQQTLSQTPLAASYPPSTSTNLVMDASGNFYYSSARSGSGGTADLTCCTVKYNSTAVTPVTELDAGDTTSGTNFVAVNSTTAWATMGGSSLSFVATLTKTKMSGGGLNGAMGVALDNSGRAWVANSMGNSISLYSGTGALLSSTPYTGNLATPQAIAVDGLGNVWASNSTGSVNLAEFTSAGAAVGNGYSKLGLANAAAMAIDPSGNLWVASSTSSTITQFLGLAAPVVTPMATAIGAGTLGTRP